MQKLLQGRLIIKKTDIYEGQIMITRDKIFSTEKFEVEGRTLRQAIIERFENWFLAKISLLDCLQNGQLLCRNLRKLKIPAGSDKGLEHRRRRSALPNGAPRRGSAESLVFCGAGAEQKMAPPLTSKKKLFFEWRFFYAECKVYGVFGAWVDAGTAEATFADVDFFCLNHFIYVQSHDAVFAA